MKPALVAATVQKWRGYAKQSLSKINRETYEEVADALESMSARLQDAESREIEALERERCLVLDASGRINEAFNEGIEAAAAFHDGEAERLLQKQRDGDYTVGGDIRRHGIHAIGIRSLKRSHATVFDAEAVHASGVLAAIDVAEEYRRGMAEMMHARAAQEKPVVVSASKTDAAETIIERMRALLPTSSLEERQG